MQITIGNQFKMIRKIGQGSFGQIFQGFNTKRGHKVAIKLQQTNSKYLQLHHQARILQHLLSSSSTVTDIGIPNLYSKGQQGQFNYIVMDLLGPSLEILLRKNNNVFSMKTVLMIGDQMFKRIQYIHSKGVLHRDIKPENFLISAKKDRKVYLIDFGLSKKYMSNKSAHFPYAQNKSLIGTIRYASLNNHYGIEPTRRDDVQSWFYCLYYFIFGQLPWQGIKAANRKQKYEKIMQIKIQNRPQILCAKLPVQFCNIFSHIRGLKFEQKPGYEYIKSELMSIMRNKQYEYDYNYDWQAKKDLMSKFLADKK